MSKNENMYTVKVTDNSIFVIVLSQIPNSYGSNDETVCRGSYSGTHSKTRCGGIQEPVLTGKKLSSVEDRAQTVHVTTLSRRRALDSAAADLLTI